MVFINLQQILAQPINEIKIYLIIYKLLINTVLFSEFILDLILTSFLPVLQLRCTHKYELKILILKMYLQLIGKQELTIYKLC